MTSVPPGISSTISGVCSCKTCAHWKFEEPDWEFDELRFGVCKAIKQREDINSEATEGMEDRWSDEAREAIRKAVAASKAIAVDGSGYYAALRTAPDFGCILHAAIADPSEGKEIPGGDQS